MTVVPDPGGVHVLMLAANADQHIAKQAASLTGAGYRVSTFAPATVEYPDPRPGAPALHQQIFHMPDVPAPGHRAAVDNPLLAGVFDAPIAGQLSRITALEDIRHDMRWAFRLRRLFTGLQVSGQQRRAKVQDFRARRRHAYEALLPPDCANRLDIIVRYASQALAFCDTALEWQARVTAFGPPGVVHAHDIFTLAAGVALARRYGARLVYDAHEYEPERTPVLPTAERRLIALFEDRVLPWATGLQTVSGSIVALYRDRFPALQTNLLMNCPALNAAGAEVPGLRARTGLGAEVPLAVFVGLPELEGRGLGVVLEAMTHLPDLHLAVIGPRWEARDTELMAAVHAAGLSARVHVLDPVAPGDVITAIGDADFSVCLMQDTSLNHRFALPNKLFESLLAGVPVLVADLPDMSALVRRLGAGLVVDQTDPKAVSDVMRQVLADRAEFSPTGEGRVAVEAACSWEGQEQGLLGFYDRVLNADAVPNAVSDAGQDAGAGGQT